MDGQVFWIQRDPIRASIEIAKTGNVQVKYTEPDGYKIDTLLKSDDGLRYHGDYVAIDIKAQRAEKVDPSRLTRKGSITVNRYENPDEYFFFGELVENGTIYDWWIRAEKTS